MPYRHTDTVVLAVYFCNTGRELPNRRVVTVQCRESISVSALLTAEFLKNIF